MTKKLTFLAMLAVATLATNSAMAVTPNPGVWITEFNSNSGDGQDYEFVEFTNVSAAPIDMTGWSESDSDRDIQGAGHVLTAFGELQPGESAIFTEAMPDAFRIYWWGSVEAAPVDLKIIGPYSNDNLSSGGDEINLFGPDALVGTTDYADRLWYSSNPAGSAEVPQGGGAASGVTRNPTTLDVLGQNTNYLWVNSAIDDEYGSFAAAGNAALVGNPGKFLLLEEPLDGDLDSDGFVGQSDLNLILGNWGQDVPPANPLADGDASGSVGQGDLNLVLSGWGQGTPPPNVAAVPEPATFVLLGLAGVGLLAVRVRNRRAT
ncbi:MAG: lamin tail domain-containing protein [Planctomycetota bacterium]|nr:lamin tail domain-containing protein [Planctomycetota bacterium]